MKAAEEGSRSRCAHSATPQLLLHGMEGINAALQRFQSCCSPKYLVMFLCQQAQRLVCRARKENKDKAAAHVKAGNKQAAYECYQRAVDISPATANDFAKVCKQDKPELQISGTSVIGSQCLNRPWFRLGQQQTCLFHMHIPLQPCSTTPMLLQYVVLAHLQHRG